MDDIFERVRTVIETEIGVEASLIEPDSRFIEDLGCDSLDIVELDLALEVEFGIIHGLEDIDVGSVNKVEDLVNHIKTALEKKPSRAG